MIDLSSIQNAPYTPMYAARGYSPTPPGKRDEPFVHFFSQAVNGNQSFSNFPLQLDPDADFLWRGFVGIYAPSNVGFTKLRFMDAWMNRLSSDFIITENLGGQTTPAPVYPEVFLPANSVLFADIVEYTNLGSVTQFWALYGVKRFDCQ